MNLKYWVMTKMNPNNVRKPAVTARLPPENRRLANTVTSSIGWVLCRSQNPKAASVAADTAKPYARDGPQKNRAPPEGLEQIAPGDRPGGDADTDHGCPQPDRLGARHGVS